MKALQMLKEKEGGAFDFDDFDIELPEGDDLLSPPDFGLNLHNSDKYLEDEDMNFQLDDDLHCLDIDDPNAGLLDNDYSDYIQCGDIMSMMGQSKSGGTVQYLQKDEIVDQVVLLHNIFEGYDVSDNEGTDVKLNEEEIDAFLKLDYERIAQIIYKYDSASRAKVKELLLKRKFNILYVLNKEESADLRLVYFGLFSPRHVFHTMMCNKAISKCDLDLFITIFALKPKSMINEIFESYKKVYNEDLETDVNLQFKAMSELLIYYIKADKYFHFVKQHEYYSEAGRVFSIIKSENITGFINFMVRFRQTCFKGICSEFYQRYGMTVITFFKKYIKGDDVQRMVEILQMTYLSPIYFYCRMLHTEITSHRPSVILPYLLIDLQYSGLETIMNQYKKLYEPFNAKKVASRFEDGIQEIVGSILSRYE